MDVVSRAIVLNEMLIEPAGALPLKEDDNHASRESTIPQEALNHRRCLDLNCKFLSRQ